MKAQKNLKKIRLYISCILICNVLAYCQDEQITESPKNVSVTTRAIPTLSFDWENAEWLPTPPSQSPIPSPWVGKESIASVYGNDIISDRKASDGWELMYSLFDSTAPGQLIDPYFILYNKYRGIMRIFFYITTELVIPSSYLQDGISIVSDQQTSMFNFLGQDIIDATANKSQYYQMQPAPIDGSLPLEINRWHMMQYEIAYDPNISKIPYQNIQLCWGMNYFSVDSLNLGGKYIEKINGVVGSSSEKNIFSSLTRMGKVLGSGVFAGIGKDFITRNMINEKTGENNIGLPKNTFKSIYSGVNSAISTALGHLPDTDIKLLSTSIGGSSVTTTMSYTINSEINLVGSGKDAGTFPANPVTFWVPGTNIASNAVGYIPLYNEKLGVFNFSADTQRPIIDFKVTKETSEQRPEWDEHTGVKNINKYSLKYPSRIDYSKFLIINPEVLKIAKVKIERQDLITVERVCINNEFSSNITINPDEVKWETGGDFYSPSPKEKRIKYGDRFTIRVTPFNGAPSSIIMKTLLLEDHWQGL
ncbi:hypothetical protein [uncultured Bacteroides sp.]|uniref:hypothetical protein n=1 Tax=uncultured Bacteroides sp. TaxID=162156 RepID=UPI002AA847B3|nr:hypothetical protein [uncultured Bacteroides sp.]